LILFGPDVGAGASNPVLIFRAIEFRGPLPGGTADVTRIGENAELSGLAKAEAVNRETIKSLRIASKIIRLAGAD
jgi:hypothetical protein